VQGILERRHIVALIMTHTHTLIMTHTHTLIMTHTHTLIMTHTHTLCGTHCAGHTRGGTCQDTHRDTEHDPVTREHFLTELVAPHFAQGVLEIGHIQTRNVTRIYIPLEENTF